MNGTLCNHWLDQISRSDYSAFIVVADISRMRLTILGSGTNVHPTRAAAGYLVRTDQCILLDFGPRTLMNLIKTGVNRHQDHTYLVLPFSCGPLFGFHHLLF